MYTIVFQLGFKCNLQCKYCRERPLLNDSTKVAVDKYESFCRAIRLGIPKNKMEQFAKTAHFMFAGGEPMMAPPSYFESLLQAEAEAFSPFPIQNHSLQTNLTLLNKGWVEFLKSERHRLYLGVSYDVVGDDRVFRNGRLSNDKVRRNIDTLREHEIPFGVNCVIDSKSLERMQDAIDIFEKEGLDFRFQLIQDKGSEFSAERYAQVFMTAFRKYYMNSKSKVVWMNPVAYIMDLIMGNWHSFLCTHAHCTNWMLFVLANGDVAHCPAMYEVEVGKGVKPLIYGNLLTDGFSKILTSKSKKKMMGCFDEIDRKDSDCKNCPEKSICSRGCRADVVMEGGDPSREKSIFWCHVNEILYPELKQFIEKHPIPRNIKLSQALRNEGIE